MIISEKCSFVQLPISRTMEHISTIHLIIGSSVALGSACLSSLGVNLQASSLKQERVLNQITEQEHALLMAGEWDDAMMDDIPVLSVITEYSVWELFLISIKYRVNPVLGPTQAWKRLWCRSQWYFGFTLYLLCQMFGSIIALGFISPMILAPLGSIGLIFNIIFSSIFIGTKITRFDWIGTVFIVAGCAVVSTFGSKIPQPRLSIPDIIRLFTRPAFIAYFSVELFIDLLILFLIKYLEYNLNTMKDVFISRGLSRRGSRRSHLGSHQSLTGLHQVESETGSGKIRSASESLADRRPYSGSHQSLSGLHQTQSESGFGRILNDPESATDQEFMQSENLHESMPLLFRESTTMSVRAIKRASMSTLVGVLYAILGGIIASVTLLLTKSGYIKLKRVELLIMSLFESKDQFHGVFSFTLIILLILTAVLQVFVF